MAVSGTVGARTVAARQTAERQIKAAYIARFGSYVEWPPQAFGRPDSSLSIGVVGDDLLADDLARLVAGHLVNGRRVTVHKLPRDLLSPECNVLFIGKSENGRLPDILAATKGRPTLTVTESDGALALGSIINFVIVNDRVRFEIAPGTAGMSKLGISARLLAAAYRVAPGAS